VISWGINERFDIERQVMLDICHDIARGITPSGDALPLPHVLSGKRLLNPHVVESAYAKLAEAGILRIQSGGGHLISTDAPRLARRFLLHWAEKEVQNLIDILQGAGLSPTEIETIFREAGHV
jgi:DNA-binding transcriptional regulator YhcF (GntR family)